MTRVEPFGKVAERFASQQETRFSERVLVRFPQAFITSLFQAFLKLVLCIFKRSLRALLRRKNRNPFLPPKPYSYREETPFQSRTPTNFKFLRDGDRTRVPRVGRQTQKPLHRAKLHALGQVVHKKLIYVNFAGMVSKTVCAEMLSRTAYGK
ncbi:hypothetical protein AVEN_271859-1 [Araneus ventricosus]|uniref:Uncharacterized protein n=1 Tax=Araneus ventricosus TaxID=182803 RepID=A0A4Y2F1C5_ARAVE|nr:hypothetical protein AVEN_271859-1 [Araneus ventricosus]